MDGVSAADLGLVGTDARRFDEGLARLELTPSVGRALRLAALTHRGQRDRGGVAYVLHPLQLALGAQTEDERCAALLHDVLEDTNVSLAELQSAGFNHAVLRALQSLTKRSDESYDAFIARIARDRLATRVKLLDLAHNSDLSRLGAEPSARDLERVRKYAAATQTLRAELAKRNLYVMLDVASRQLALAAALLPVPKAHHVTFAHRVAVTTDLSPYLHGDYRVGQELALTAVAECRSEQVQLWVIELEGRSVRPLDGGTLHLTLSRSSEARSRDANDLLGTQMPTPLATPQQLRGTLDWVDD